MCLVCAQEVVRQGRIQAVLQEEPPSASWGIGSKRTKPYGKEEIFFGLNGKGLTAPVKRNIMWTISSLMLRILVPER